MQIKSNTLGKLQKIRNGNVFDSPYIFIRELLQNSQRSKAKNIYFEVYNNKFVCYDDGCGCKNPENVFTLDLSDWESTDEGYGIGFWSCLCIPELKSISVQSKNWICKVDAERLFEIGDLSVNMEKSTSINGFRVIFESDFFLQNYEEVEDYVNKCAEYMSLNVIFDGIMVPKKDIFDDFKPNSFCMEFNNRLFRAKFAVLSRSWSNVSLYYEKRLVREDVGFAGFVEGVMELKKGGLTLREPDRTNWVNDEKYRNFCKKVDACIKELYIAYIKRYGVDDEEFVNAIFSTLDLKDYEKYLSFDEEMVQQEILGEVGESYVEAASIASDAVNMVVFNSSEHKQDDNVHVQSPRIFVPETTISSKPNNSFASAVKKMKRSVWVGKNEYPDYQDSIQKANYQGLNVIIARNKLYEQVLIENRIIHISNLQDCFTETFIRTDVELKTNKEEAFIEMLNPIIRHFNLDRNIFMIANLTVESVFHDDNGEVIFKKKITNKHNNIQIYGETNGIYVYLDRKALGLHRFNIKKGNFGIWELKALMSNINTIAHELAHYFYNTTDNTPEHYQHEVDIQKQIIELYTKSNVIL